MFCIALYLYYQYLVRVLTVSSYLFFFSWRKLSWEIELLFYLIKFQKLSFVC